MAALVFRITGKHKVSLSIFIVALVWLVVSSTSPIPQWLTLRLESTHKVIDLEGLKKSDSIHILVLGGGHIVDPDLPALDQLSHDALGRVAEAIRIHHRIPESKIVCSGFSATNRITQAEMLGLAAIELGIKPSDTLLTMRPNNTKAEAEHYAKRFGSNYTLILVTNAIHMKRAIKYFQHNGLRPIPAPTNHLIKRDPTKSLYTFFPSTSKMMMTQHLLHEYGGLIEFQLFE